MPRINLYKYKETPTFHFYNANPKGKNASDCVFRAICVALDQGYEETVREMTEFGLSKGYVANEDKTVKLFLESKGWETCKEPRDLNNKKISVERFLLRADPNRVYVVLAGSHHCTLIKNGKVWDSWDCSKKTMHRYWRKK